MHARDSQAPRLGGRLLGMWIDWLVESDDWTSLDHTNRLVGRRLRHDRAVGFVCPLCVSATADPKGN